MGKKNTNQYTALFLISLALGFGPQVEPEAALGKLMNTAPITYKYIDGKILDKIEQKGIPAREPLPFKANWTGIVEDIEIKSEHARAWIATLLCSEWNFMYWLHNTIKKDIINEITGRHNINKGIEMILQKEGSSVSDNFIGSSTRDIEIKWWIDDLAIRIRAVWDRLPHAIAATSELKLELTRRSHNSRIDQLVENKQELGLLGEEEKLFNALIPQMRDIEYVTKYRDAESHKHTHRAAEIFGLYGTDEPICTQGFKMLEELNRCRESLMATIGLIILR